MRLGNENFLSRGRFSSKKKKFFKKNYSFKKRVRLGQGKVLVKNFSRRMIYFNSSNAFSLFAIISICVSNLARSALTIASGAPFTNFSLESFL